MLWVGHCFDCGLTVCNDRSELARRLSDSFRFSGVQNVFYGRTEDESAKNVGPRLLTLQDLHVCVTLHNELHTT